MRAWRATAEKAVRRLQRNGLGGGAIALLILALAPPTPDAHGFTGPLAWWLLLAFCLPTLALSAHLLFDAALFRLATSHDAEEAGLAAIDDVLARMGLRARDGVTRPLSERIAGCRRLVWLQRGSIAVAIVFDTVLQITTDNGTGLC